jgi:hypothetical protein
VYYLYQQMHPRGTASPTAFTLILERLEDQASWSPISRDRTAYATTRSRYTTERRRRGIANRHYVALSGIYVKFVDFDEQILT